RAGDVRAVHAGRPRRVAAHLHGAARGGGYRAHGARVPRGARPDPSRARLLRGRAGRARGAVADRRAQGEQCSHRGPARRHLLDGRRALRGGLLPRQHPVRGRGGGRALRRPGPRRLRHRRAADRLHHRALPLLQRSAPRSRRPARRLARSRMDRAVAWIKRWGISLCSLSLGLSTLLVFRRGLPHGSWVGGYLLTVVVPVAAVAERRGPLEDRGRRLVLRAADYAVQTLYHGLLLFVLPAYWASTTFDSRNVIFLVGVIVGALGTAVAPWDAALVPRRRVLTP